MALKLRQACGSIAQAYGRLSIAYKIALGSWLVLLIGMGVLLVLVVNYQRLLLGIQIESLGNIIASQFAASVTEPLFTDDALALGVQANNLVRDPRIRAALIRDDQGKIVARARQVDTRSGAVGRPDRQELAGRGVVSVSQAVIFNSVSAGEVTVEFETLEVSRSFGWILRTLISMTVIMLLLLMLLAFVVSRGLSRPITTMVEATEKIGAGEYNIKLLPGRQDELGRLSEAVNRMAIGLQHKRRVETLLNKVVASDVAKALLTGTEQSHNSSEKVEASVLFVDIVGFTSLAERHSPAEIVTLLNEYFGYFTLCSQLFFGSVDKFIGDCAMIIFGAPRHSEDHRFQALGCAVAIQRLLAELGRRHANVFDEPVQVRIGVNSGEVMAGMVGTQQRMEYTVIGDTVNLASRLTALAQPAGILAGEATIEHSSLKGRVTYQPLAEFSVKGKLQTTRAVQVLNISPDYSNIIDGLIEDIVS